MKRQRRSHFRSIQEAELDITAFMNLMIVLVPVLLLSMVFSHISVLQLDLPKPLSDESSEQPLDESLKLEVIIRADGIEIGDIKGGLIRYLPREKKQSHDYANLQAVLKSIKARFPDKKDVSLLADKNIPYQAIISAMDAMRSYQTVVVTSVVDAELFPNISLGDAPLKSAAKPAPAGRS